MLKSLVLIVPVPNSGAIWRIQEGEESELIYTGLSFPTSIDFNEAGDAYITINRGWRGSRWCPHVLRLCRVRGSGQPAGIINEGSDLPDRRG